MQENNNYSKHKTLWLLTPLFLTEINVYNSILFCFQWVQFHINLSIRLYENRWFSSTRSNASLLVSLGIYYSLQADRENLDIIDEWRMSLGMCKQTGLGRGWHGAGCWWHSNATCTSYQGKAAAAPKSIIFPTKLHFWLFFPLLLMSCLKTGIF